METILYDELVGWYRLLDPLEDHAEEGADFAERLARACDGPCETLLELGSGAGHNAYYLKKRLQCTLVDLSEAMLGLSREINPDCEHLPGDMRTLRLGRTFDAVLIHDAIVYMTREADLRAALETAFVHTRSGGAAIFAPDCVGNHVQEFTELHERDEGRRSLRALSWTWDPDPADTTYVADYAFLLRDGAEVRAVQDRHVAGIFPEDTWLALMASVGWRPERLHRPAPAGYTETIFLAHKP